MSYALLITETAERDLNEAVDYIDHILLNPQAADDLLEAFEQRAASIGNMPQKFALSSDPILRSWGIRIVTVKDYLLFSWVSEAEETVTVIRFMHARRDWMAILHRSLL